MEKEIEKLMQKLKISREEAIELIEEDKKINRMTLGELNAEMSAEERKVIKSMTSCSKGVPRKKVNKVRKVDEIKKDLFEIIIKSLEGTVENGALKNEVDYNFDYQGANYTLKLTRHGNKKKK